MSTITGLRLVQGAQPSASMAGELIVTIQTRLAERAAAQAHLSPRNQPYASDADPNGCLRRQVLSITNWQERAPIPADRQGRLEAGVEAESKAIRLLKEVGLGVVKEQMPFELRHRRTGAPCLRGKIDAFIQWKAQEVPTEVKSLHPLIFDRLHTLDDLSNFWWTKRYLYQLHAYMIGYGLPECLLLITNLLGDWKLFSVSIDYEIAERIWAYAESILDAVDVQRAKGILPDFTKDVTQCAHCDFFGRSCQPPITEMGALILGDPELHAQLERWYALRDQAKEYGGLDKKVKESLRKALPEDRPRGLAGRFAIEITQKPVKAFDVKARTDRIVSIEPLLAEPLPAAPAGEGAPAPDLVEQLKASVKKAFEKKGGA